MKRSQGRSLAVLVLTLAASGAVVAVPPVPPRPLSPGTIEAQQAALDLHVHQQLQRVNQAVSQAAERQVVIRTLADIHAGERQALVAHQQQQVDLMNQIHQWQHQDRVNQRQQGGGRP